VLPGEDMLLLIIVFPQKVEAETGSVGYDQKLVSASGYERLTAG
jgi:hypothetical protein